MNALGGLPNNFLKRYRKCNNLLRVSGQIGLSLIKDFHDEVSVGESLRIMRELQELSQNQF